MDRSVEMRLRMDISNFMRNGRTAGSEMGALTAQAALLDAQLDRVNASATGAGEGLRSTRSQTALLGRDAERTTPQLAAAQQQLDAFTVSAGRSSTQLSAFSTQTQQTGRQLDQGGAAIDKFSGRLGLMIQAAAVLGPALIPLGAVALPAITGLANMLGAAALAGGSLIIAMQGVGEAVKAVDAYQLDPTVANLEAAQAALENLGPEAQAFVGAFQDFQPVLTSIRDAAAEGWFPGLTESLTNLERIAPRVQTMMRDIGEAGGDVLADATDSLASERWAGFLDFLGEEMPTALVAAVSIVGDLTHGLSELWMAFDPLNDDFTSWMVDSAAGFDQWAAGLSKTEGFTDFIDYVRETGPQVEDTLAAFGAAVVDFIQAAAPLGGPVLGALEEVFRGISAIMESPLGPKLAVMAAGFVILNKSLAVTAALLGKLGFLGAAGALRGAAPGRAAAPVAPVVAPRPMAGIPAIIGGLTAVTSAQDRASTSAGRLTAAQQQQRAAMARMGRAVAIGAAGAALFAVATGKMGDDLNLTNTAMLGLVGSMAGPWGAAIGVAAGLGMDFAKTNDAIKKAVEEANAVIGDGSSFDSMADSISNVVTERNKLRDSLAADKDGAIGKPFSMATGKHLFEKFGPGTPDIEEADAALRALEARMKTSQEAAAGLGRAMGMTIGPLDGSVRSVGELEAALLAAKPAMDKLNISQEDLVAAQEQQEAIDAGGTWGAMAAAIAGTSTPLDDLTERIRAQSELMDSAAGRASNYRDMLRDLATDAGTAAEQADRFREAMEGLVSPALDAEAALSAQRDALKDISELNADAGFTQASEVGRQNLAVTRDYTSAVKERLATMINAGRSEQDIARALATSREQFIASGVAAGFSAREMRKRANEIGLTPRLVETTFRTLGFDKGERAAFTLRSAIQAMPKDKATAFRAEGVPKTMADVNRLVEKYELTEKERQALVTLMDKASPGLRNIKGALDSIQDKSVTVTTTYRHVNVGGPRGAAMDSEGTSIRRAAGGLVTGPGGPRDDAIVARLSNREYVQQAAAVDYYGLPLMDALNHRLIPRDLITGDLGLAPGLAGGGTPDKPRKPRRAPATASGQLLGGVGVDASSLGGVLAFYNFLVTANKRELKERERILKNELKRDERAVRREERDVAAAKQRLDTIKAERDSIVETIAARTKSQLFGLDQGDPATFVVPEWNMPDNFGEMTIEQQNAEQARYDREVARAKMLFDYQQAFLKESQNPLKILQDDVDKAAELFRLSNILGSRGLDGDAVTELLATASMEQIREFAFGSQANLKEYERLYELRDELGMKAGVAAANADGVTLELQGARADYRQQLDELKAARQEAAMTNRRMERINNQLERLEKLADRAPERTGKAVGAAVNGAVVAGQAGRGPR